MDEAQAVQERTSVRRRRARRRPGPYSPEARQQAVETYLKSGIPLTHFAKMWRITPRTLTVWVEIYEKHGAAGLSVPKPGRKNIQGRIPQPVGQEIVAVKREFPSFGFKRVRAFLERFRGVKVSVGSVRKAVRAEGLPPGEGWPRRRRKINKPRRFERARPGDLWQSDWTSLVLPRTGQRLYLVAFIDDYSRYVMSWGLHVSQRSEYVVEALREGIERFGKPLEVLTDQGRQYFAWRGKSDFQHYLKREGIRHVVSRSHHPQTLGKCERFWATVQSEFWARVTPQTLAEARDRFTHFISHYNHFRPHQGIENLVPADRLFGAENAVRKSLEAAFEANELNLAVGESPRRPVYLAGQIGDTPISLVGEKGRLVFQSADGERQEMAYDALGMARTGKDEEKGDGERGEEAGEKPGGADADDRGREEDSPEAGREEEDRVCDAADGGTGEGIADDGAMGGAGGSAQAGDTGAGDVAGEEDEGASGGGDRGTGGADEADLGCGAFRDGCGAAETAQEDAEGGDAAGGQPDVVEEADSGSGGGASDTAGAGGPSQESTGEPGACRITGESAG